MSGRVGLSMVDNVGVLFVDVALTLLLVPWLGIVGAALAWSVSLVVVNAVKVLQVHRVLGIVAVGSRVGPLVLVSLPAAAVGLAVRALVERPLVELVVGVPLVVALQAVLLIRVGIAPEDRDNLRKALRKVRRVRRRTTPVA